MEENMRRPTQTLTLKLCTNETAAKHSRKSCFFDASHDRPKVSYVNNLPTFRTPTTPERMLLHEQASNEFWTDIYDGRGPLTATPNTNRACS
jgi:hypothetical protein